MVSAYINKVMTKIFGSRNERMIKSYRKRLAAINELEPEMRKLSDVQLKELGKSLERKLENKEITDMEVLPRAFAIMRESMDRQIGLRAAFNPEMKFDRESLPTQALKDLYTDVLF